MSSIYLGGSRSLPPSSTLRQLVQAAIQSGQVVHVGCATGADEQVIQAALALGTSSFRALRVFSAFGSSGAGAWSGSAVQVVQQAAAAGASVSWLAGGSLAIPLAGRLIRRSHAALQGCTAALFFRPGRGSLAVAGYAVAAGLPVYAISQAAPSAPHGCLGSWQPASIYGVTCWLWQPAAIQQSLL